MLRIIAFLLRLQALGHDAYELSDLPTYAHVYGTAMATFEPGVYELAGLVRIINQMRHPMSEQAVIPLQRRSPLTVPLQVFEML